MSLAQGLAEAIERADAEAVVCLVVDASEKERRAAAKEMAERFEPIRLASMRNDDQRRLASALAWAGTNTARKLNAEPWVLSGVPMSSPELVEVVAARGRQFMDTVVRGAFRQDNFFSPWPLVRGLVRAGHIEPPADPGYITGLVWGVSAAGQFQPGEHVYRGLLADPDLLETELWLLFEVDAGSELSNARAWPSPGQAADNMWTLALVRLADEGRLDRQRLLDASLDALMRDFRPTTVGWYAKFHEALEPTREERVARIDTYLALLGSSAPAAVKQGLEGLKAVEDELDAERLAAAAAGPLSLPQKAHAVAALRLLERAARRDAAGRPRLLGAAAEALGHERADVQERALALVEPHAAELPELRATLLGYTDAVAPQLRPRLEAITGVAVDGAPVSIGIAPVAEWPRPRVPQPTAEAVLARAEPVAPVESVDELIELGAALLEGQGSGDDAERFLDGVSRLCAERPPGFERRSAALRKRAAEQHPGFGYEEGARLVALLVLAWLERQKPARPVDPMRAFTTGGGGVLSQLIGEARALVKAPRQPGLAGFVTERVRAVAQRAAAGKARPLLALPTHRGGWIAPDLLQARGRSGADDRDAQQAHARAFPDVRELAVQASLVEARPHEYLPSEMRVSVEIERAADLGEIGERAAETVPLSEHWWYSQATWGGADPLSARWSLTVMPGLPEPAFASALTWGVAFVDGAIAYQHPEIVLEHALDPGVRIPDIGWKAVAAALLAKSPDLQRAATDVLVQSVSDGRFHPAGLGAALAWLLEAGVGTSSRLGPPLRDAGRVSPLHGAQLLRAVTALAAGLSKPPHGFHVPLEVGLEHAVAAGAFVDDDAGRVGLERVAASVSRGSKLGRAAAGLLELPPDEERLGRLRAEAAELASAA